MKSPNLMDTCPSLIKPSFLLLILILILLNLYLPIHANQSIEWQILTKRNFSTQIHLHPHILLLITLPWSGESRSLMKQIASVYKHDDLRLMIMYKNKDKMLADVLGVNEETSIFIYNHGVSYRYRGRLRARNVLYSVNYLISVPPEELPLKLLKNKEDLNLFYESTDKAVVLFEFCGWTDKLMSQRRMNGSESGFLLRDGIISGANFYGERNLSPASGQEENQKGSNNEKLTCGAESGLGEIPCVGGFTSANQSATSETEYTVPGAGMSCTFDEFQKFEAFFSEFMTLSREFFLPPERQSFGLVTERFLLTSLEARDHDSWVMVIHVAGCPNCSKVLKDGNDFRSALHMHHSPVTELEREGNDADFTLPANKPSMILFVDRSSESLITKRKSQAALQVFRKFALDNHVSIQTDLKETVTLSKFSAQAFPGKEGGSASDQSKHPRRHSTLTRVGSLKNKVSVMVINEGEKIVLNELSADAQGRSIHDILALLLQQKKQAKLSSVAKEVGFRLLSDDFEVKLAELLQPQTNSKSNKPLLEVPTGNIAENDVNPDKANVHNDEILTLLEPEDLTGVEPSKIKERTVTYIVKHTEIIPSSPDQMTADRSLPQDVMVEEKSSTEAEKLDVQEPTRRDVLRFYFSDCGYQLLNSLTARSEIPSVVIVDPFSEQHFIYPQQKNFSYSSLQGFLDGFLNGSLVPFQRSESVSRSPREATQPPFVNLDFREFDSIPRVTAHTFSELVLGFNQSHTRNFGHSWENDVLVLFSNSWCGFCQRMELVVREVFRAFKGYVNVLKSGNTELSLNIDIHEDAKLPEFPLIFLMDCTSNDCTSLLKSMGQREVYPALLLFPAQRKTAVSYRGDMSVNNVMKFLIDHGSNSHHLNRVEGILWTVRGKGSRDEVRIKDSSPALIRIKEDSAAKREYLEVLLNKTPTRSTETHPTESHSSNDLHEATPDVLVGSMLVSTDKLLNAPPFDKSVILIVQANQSIGFQGLIINKHMSWESFEKLDKHLELVRQAPLSFGGPVIAQGMPLVCMTRRITQESYPEVLPSVYFLDHLATVRELEGFKLGNKSSDDYWFFLGYSSWGWDQLFAEIAEGAWQISDDPVGDFNWPGS